MLKKRVAEDLQSVFEVCNDWTQFSYEIDPVNHQLIVTEYDDMGDEMNIRFYNIEEDK